MARSLTSAAVIGVVLAALVACGSPAPSGPTQEANGSGSEYPMTVQSCDRTVTIPRQPQRVITLGAEAPIFVAAAGAAKYIVGESKPDGPLGQYDAAVGHLPVIAPESDKNLSIEEITALNPDLVVHRGPGNDLQPATLDQVGIPNIVVSGRCTSNTSGIVANGTYDQIYSDLMTFGRIFGTESIAQSAVTQLRNRVAAVAKNAAAVRPGSTAAAIIVENGTYAYGNRATLQSMMATLGLRNVFQDRPERAFEVNLEEVVNRDPDILIILTESAALAPHAVESIPALVNLRAIRQGHVLTLNFALTAASPLAVDGLEQLANQLSRLPK